MVSMLRSGNERVDEEGVVMWSLTGVSPWMSVGIKV